MAGAEPAFSPPVARSAVISHPQHIRLYTRDTTTSTHAIHTQHTKDVSRILVQHQQMALWLSNIEEVRSHESMRESMGKALEYSG
jgi:hypothetical protein